MRSRFLLALAFACIPVLAGIRPASFVPWRILKAGEQPVAAPLSVYWIPASHDDFRHSELLHSDDLSLFSTQCVAMQVVRPEDEGMVAKLDSDGKLPIVVLFDGDGRELARLHPEKGPLRVEEVESMVRAELDERGSAADQLLDQAREKAEAGETSAAIAIYSRVLNQRCTCPRQARAAQRALKKLKR